MIPDDEAGFPVPDPKREAEARAYNVALDMAQVIYDLREETGLGQAAFAERVGFTAAEIEDLEDADHHRALCVQFGQPRCHIKTTEFPPGAGKAKSPSPTTLLVPAAPQGTREPPEDSCQHLLAGGSSLRPDPLTRSGPWAEDR
ncbi:MAG: hypothetical protein K0S72_754 [Arthrobacter sp.]|nr:hypothetical protein [Arthrobacter sp.]